MKVVRSEHGKWHRTDELACNYGKSVQPRKSHEKKEIEEEDMIHELPGDICKNCFVGLEY